MNTRVPAFRLWVLSSARAAAIVLLVAGCVVSSLPSIERMERNATGPVQLEGARGPLSTEQSAAILETLKEKNGNPSILERHVAIEEAAVDSPLVIGNKAVLLQDGPATYKAMFAAIRKARHHINLETYIIEDDEVGPGIHRPADRHEKERRPGQHDLRQRRQSQARRGNSSSYLRDNGISVLEFNPVNPLAVKKAWLLNNRDHRKLLIVDGRIAFLGGINISSVYSSGSAPSGQQLAKKKRNGRVTQHPGATRMCRSKARSSPSFRSFSCRPGRSRAANR